MHNCRQVILLLSVIPFIDTADAESHKISGYVVDSSDVAIANVKVTLFDPDNGDIRTDITDGIGYFSIYAPAGHYLASYSHPMYVTPTSLLQMNEKDTYLQFIHLTKIAGQAATLTGHVEDADGPQAGTLIPWGTSGIWPYAFSRVADSNPFPARVIFPPNRPLILN